MQRILVHWRKIIYTIFGLKLLAILTLPIGGDFLYGWTYETSSVVQRLLAGKLPAISTYGVYLGIEIILAPFYWLWTILPVEHPNLTTLIQHSASAVSLSVLMKTPILLCDAVVLILLLRIVRQITNSEQKSIIAGLSWFGNPYNFYMLYYFGAMDIIPIAVFLLAIHFELDGRWIQSGIATMFSGLLRLFPFVTYPFFIPMTKTGSTARKFILGSAIPLALTISLVYLSHDTLATIFNIPAQQPWLLEFLGFNLWGTQFIKLSPVLVLFQLYVVFRFWRSDTNIVYLASVSLLALLLGGTLYGGESQHFLWVCPLLSACVALQPEDSWIYVLTFLFAITSPTVNPFGPWEPDHVVFDTFLAGIFYAMKAVYLVKLNVHNVAFVRH